MSKKLGHYWSKKPSLRREKVHDFARRAVRFVQGSRKGKKLLDLGCGFGQDALYFARHGWQVTAIDLAPDNIRKLQENSSKASGKMHCLCRDISKPLPFKDASFDVVYAHLSVHYFDDKTTQKMFREIHRILQPGGFFFVKCKSIDDPLFGKGKRVGQDTYLLQHVRHFFRKEYMQELLEGWVIKHVRRTRSSYASMPSAFIEAIARKRS